uniref:Uncharacterized protein n=1 Tax=Tetradesmus obliquus TaxID=3088 RepID=A0A383VGC9_TETOB|eukprot:jgi/Sobl393_1/16185/SZX63993.1
MYSGAAGSSSSGSSSSSSYGSRSGGLSDALAKQMCGDIMVASKDLITLALLMVKMDTFMGGSCRKCHSFLANPAVPAFALQLLATRCLLLHEQHMEHLRLPQQEWLRAWRLGRRMRRDLLLLPSPQVEQLLPGDAFVAAANASGSTADIKSAVAETAHLVESLDVSVSSSSNSSSSSSSPVLSAAALRLSVHLLLRAAALWQKHYHSLTEQQQALLKLGGAAVNGAAREELKQARHKMSSAENLLLRCNQLLHKQMRLLWRSGQWQPQMQLLPQLGGHVLLQGLSLAVRQPGQSAARGAEGRQAHECVAASGDGAAGGKR